MTEIAFTPPATTTATTTAPAAQPAPQPAPAPDLAAPLGEPGLRALQAERDRVKALQTELDTIRTAQLSDIEKANRRAEKAQNELAALQAAALRQTVALAKGLPANLVNRLQGTTEAELMADADELAALVNTSRTPQPDLSQGAASVDIAISDDPLLASLKEKLGIV